MQPSYLTKTVLVLAAIAIGGVSIRVWMLSTANETKPANREGLIRITPHRIPLAASVAVLCIAPASVAYGPHTGAAEVHIYANQRAIDYRRDHPNEFDYPIGSIFVKEKYSHSGDEKPEVATIMERTHATGDVMDWTFSIVSLPDKTPLKPTGRVACAECHRGYKNTGYVSTQSELALRKHLGIE